MDGAVGARAHPNAVVPVGARGVRADGPGERPGARAGRRPAGPQAVHPETLGKVACRAARGPGMHHAAVHRGSVQVTVGEASVARRGNGRPGASGATGVGQSRERARAVRPPRRVAGRRARAKGHAGPTVRVVTRGRVVTRPRERVGAASLAVALARCVRDRVPRGPRVPADSVPGSEATSSSPSVGSGPTELRPRAGSSAPSTPRRIGRTLRPTFLRTCSASWPRPRVPTGAICATGSPNG